MEKDVKKIIQLMKKCYDQPLIFHKLHMHLILILKKLNNLYQIDDEWSKLIIFSASTNKVPNQGLEMKIQKFMRRIRPPLENTGKIKLMIICYYLINRPVKLINHIVLFELVTNFLEINDYFDGLIIKILKRICTADIYQLESNPKLSVEALSKMIEILRNSNLSLINQNQLLPIYINSKIIPPTQVSIDLNHSLQAFKYLDNILMYIKYCKFQENIESILPNHPDFEKEIENMLNFNYVIKKINKTENYLMENNKIFHQIKEAYEHSGNKKKFVEKMMIFLENLIK
ncbi:hypothetical protein NUSPORA_00669 [Nucleospora cyclopteri]